MASTSFGFHLKVYQGLALDALKQDGLETENVQLALHVRRMQGLRDGGRWKLILKTSSDILVVVHTDFAIIWVGCGDLRGIDKEIHLEGRF